MDRYQGVRRPLQKEIEQARRRRQPARPPSDSSLSRQPRLSPLIQLMRFGRHHPFFVLLITWIGLLALGGLALTRLVPPPPAPEPPWPAATAQFPAASPLPASLSPTALEQEEHSMPLLSLGAIALSCTVGCWWLSKTLGTKPSPTQRHGSQPSHFPQGTAPLPLPIRPPMGSTTHNPSATPFQPQASASDLNADQEITILPPNQSHPLDWDEPSLADHLDLRQQKPLSRWIPPTPPHT